jgi:hypothetical protein
MSDVGAPFHQRHGAALGFLLFASLAFASPVLKIYADRNIPLAADLAPGADAWMRERGDRVPCPARRWTEGEFLPSACIDDHDLPDRLVEYYGLGPNYLMSPPVGERGRRYGHHGLSLRSGTLLAPFYPYRWRYWVKSGPDALLVAGGQFTSGQVLKVVRDRFRGGSAPVDDAVQAADFSAPPNDYVQATRNSLWTNSLVLGLVAFAFLVWGVAKRLFGEAG